MHRIAAPHPDYAEIATHGVTASEYNSMSDQHSGTGPYPFFCIDGVIFAYLSL